MKPKVPPQLRKDVWDLVRNLGRPNWSIYASYDKMLPGIIQDILHYQHQSSELSRTSEPQYAAIFRDEGPKGKQLPVLVQVPDISNLLTSYRALLDELRAAKLKLNKVDSGEAEEIFVDRLSEFIAVGNKGGPPANLNAYVPASTSTLTVVNSNRGGDTVLYAKGYFTSTGTAFGVSTPAKGHLSSGRYSFGIMDSGVPKFEGIVWSCPTTVRLNLP